MNAPSAPASNATPSAPPNNAFSNSFSGNGNGNGNITQATSVLQRPAPAEKPFTPLVRQFLDYLRLEKHFSDYTVKSYGADLIQFGQYLGGEIGPASATPNRQSVSAEQLDERKIKCEPLTVREFLNYLYGQNYTKSTTARKLATLRSFYKFLIRRGMVSVNPLSTIRTPKQEKRLPKCLVGDREVRTTGHGLAVGGYRLRRVAEVLQRPPAQQIGFRMITIRP